MSDSTNRVDDALNSAADQAKDTRSHRLLWMSLIGLLCGLTLIGIGVVCGYRMINDLEARADANAIAAQALAEQIRSTGGTPVVQPPIPGEQGPPGPIGPAGRDGTNGADGRDGLDGTTPPCMSTPSQCQGHDGTNGIDGQPGKDGADGKDGTNGIDGRDGVDGQPPSGWTWTDTTGRLQSCTRDAGSPDTAPTYTCTAPSPPPPTTQPGE